MSKKHLHWAVPLVLTGAAASAQDAQTPPAIGYIDRGPAAQTQTNQPAEYIYRDSTNRLTLSLRFALNISAKFKGIGTPYTAGSIYGYGRTTPDGDRYNYDNGYVLRDSTGNFLGYTSDWGYDSGSQVNAAGFPANTIAFDQTKATAPTSASSDRDRPPGLELTYDHQWGVKEDWHHLRYGWEAAANYMWLSMQSDSSSLVDLVTTTTAYSFQPGDTPPGAPFQGTFSGSGYMLLQVPPDFPTTPGSPVVIPGAAFTSSDEFNGHLFGFRLGPYLELPVSEKMAMRLDGGVAVGLIYSAMHWKETLTPPGGPTLPASGGGSSLDVLWGGYVGLDATYQFNEHWGLDVGAQFQDIGTFNHNYQGREVQLDLSRSLFLEAGISYTF